MHSPLFFLKNVEIEDFGLRVAILDDRECQICFGGSPSVHILGNGKIAARTGKNSIM